MRRRSCSKDRGAGVPMERADEPPNAALASRSDCSNTSAADVVRGRACGRRRARFRADLFDVVGEPVGNLRSAHFHPYFDGIEPCDRHWRPVIKQDPIRWLEGRAR